MKIKEGLLAVVALLIMAQDAAAKKNKRKASPPVKPSACMIYAANPESRAVGPWRLAHRDDGQTWAGPWDIEIKADGTWTKDGKPSGFWCENGDMIFLGYSDPPHTTYRGLLGLNSVQGAESWNGGGAGIFEMTR